MNITLTYYKNEIYIESTQSPKYLSIHYKGDFQGELFGDVKYCWVDKNKIIVEFTGKPEELLMKYRGNLTIVASYAYDDDKNRSNVIVKKVSDEINRILSKWSTSTQKYEEYNSSNKYSRALKTSLKFTRNGIKYIANNKLKYRVLNDNNLR